MTNVEPQPDAGLVDEDGTDAPATLEEFEITARAREVLAVLNDVFDGWEMVNLASAE